MRDRFRRLDTQERVLLWVLIVVTLAFFVSGSLRGQAPCVTQMPTLWERAPYAPQLHGSAAALDGWLPQPLDSGSLRIAPDGCVEIMFIGGGDPGFYWSRYDPANQSHSWWSNLKERMGRGVSAGHGHGTDGIAMMAYSIWPKLFGRQATLMDVADTWYRPGQRRDCTSGSRGWWICDLMAQFAEETGEAPPEPPTPEPPKPSLCDGVCQSVDRICEDGEAAGGRCPTDCNPCPGTEEPIPATCSAAACDPHVAPLRSELAACKALPALQPDIEALIRERKAGARGVGARAAVRRMLLSLCARYACPNDLRP